MLAYRGVNDSSRVSGHILSGSVWIIFISGTLRNHVGSFCHHELKALKPLLMSTRDVPHMSLRPRGQLWPRSVPF